MKKITAIVVLALLSLLVVVGCTPKLTVESIALDGLKNVYLLNEEFDYDTGLVIARMSDGTYKRVLLDDDKLDIIGFDSDTPSSNLKVTFRYEGKEAELSIKIITVQSIMEDVSQPLKKIYNTTDTQFNRTGRIKAIMTDGTDRTIAMSDTGITITGYNITPEFDKPVTITYSGKSLVVKVTVVDQDINGISVINDGTTDNRPTLHEYWTGEELDPTGGLITITPKTGGPKTVPMTDPEVKFVYDFSKRGINDNFKNKTVEVQYRGHKTTFEVELDSEVTGLDIYQAPLTSYIEGERLYRDQGSVWVRYADGDHVVVTLNKKDAGEYLIEYSGYAETDVAGKYEITLNHKDHPEFTDTYEITVSESVASPILAQLYALEDAGVSVNFVGEDIGIFGAAGKEAAIRKLYNDYETLSADKNKLINYKTRIVSLAFGLEFAELYKNAIKITNAVFEEESYQSANDKKADIQSFLNTINDANTITLLDTFSTHNTVILASGVTVASAISKMEANGKLDGEDFLEKLVIANGLFKNINELPSEIPNIPSNYNFSQEGKNLDEANDNLTTLYGGDPTVRNYYLNIMENWKEGYLEIMLEYRFQKFGSITAPEVTQLLDKATPRILIEIANQVVSAFNSVNYFGPDVSSEDTSYIMFLGSFSQVETKLADLYYRGFPSLVLAMANHPIIPMSETVIVTIQELYDYVAPYKAVANAGFSESAYVGSDAIDAFLVDFYPIALKYIATLSISDNTKYIPGVAEYDNDVLTLREGVLGLPSMDQVMFAWFLNEGVYFEQVDKYMSAKLGANSTEYKVYRNFVNIHFTYLQYVSSGTDAERQGFLDTINTELLSYNANLAGSNRAKLEQYMDLELAFVEEFVIWSADNFTNNRVTVDLQQINSHIIVCIDAKQKYVLDKFGATFLTLDKLVKALEEDGSVDEWDFFTNVSIGSLDGKTLFNHYEELKSSYESIFTIDITDNTEETKVYLAYMDMLYKQMQEENKEYKLGGEGTDGEDYIQDLEALKDAFFGLDLGEAMRFVSKGHYISNSILINSMIVPYMEAEFENDAAIKLYDKLLNVVYNAFILDATFASLENLTYWIGEYETSYAALTGDAKTEFDAKTTVERANGNFFKGIIDYASDLKGECTANEYKLIELATSAMAKMNSSYNERILAEAYAQELFSIYDSLTDSERNALENIRFMPESDLTLGTLITRLRTVSQITRLITVSEDHATQELYSRLANAIYKLYSDEENYTSGSAAWETDLNDMMAIYSDMSTFQQGAMYVLQTGVVFGEDTYYINYLAQFFEEFYYNQLNVEDLDSDLAAAVRGTSDLVFAQGLLACGYYTTAQYLEAGKSTVDSYNKLTSKTAFNASTIKTRYYDKSVEIYSALKDASDKGNFRLDIMMFVMDAVESMRFAQNLIDYGADADYSYFVNKYTTLGQYWASESINDAVRNYVDATSYKGQTFAEWRAELDALETSVANNYTKKLGVFFMRYYYVAGKFINLGVGVAITGFNPDGYVGDPITDIEMLIAHYDLLTTTQKDTFNAAFGHVYNTLLRYYYSATLQSDTDFLTWYNTGALPA